MIAAGSVVAKDIPAGVVAVGSPARVVRAIDQWDGRQSHPGRDSLNGVENSHVEGLTGIEPALSAWEAEVLPLNYSPGALRRLASITNAAPTR